MLTILFSTFFMVCRCSSCPPQTDFFVQHFVSDVAQCLCVLPNFQVDFAMSINVMEVQIPNSLAQKEGPSTFACKSNNSDRQDWYTCIFSCNLCGVDMLSMLTGH